MVSVFNTDHWPCPASDLRIDNEIPIKVLGIGGG